MRPFSVALIGADGAGKTTVGRMLEQRSTLPVRYLYMGLNPAASNRMLPTTRSVPTGARICQLRVVPD